MQQLLDFSNIQKNSCKKHMDHFDDYYAIFIERNISHFESNILPPNVSIHTVGHFPVAKFFFAKFFWDLTS